MKDPGCWEDDLELCGECNEDWPCKKVTRWHKSKDYRLQQLEATVESLGRVNRNYVDQISVMQREFDDTKKIVGALLPAVGDLLGGRFGGILTISKTVDHDDFTTLGSTAGVRVARSAELTVTYESPTGGKHVNGSLVEWNTP